MRQDQDLKSLDELIAGLGGADFGVESYGPCGLLLEHLQAARRDLLGSMPGEYGLSLRQAKEFVGCILDKGVRTKTRETLEALMAS
jgi:hypothetical protein